MLDVGPASHVTGQHWTSIERTLVLQRCSIRVVIVCYGAEDCIGEIAIEKMHLKLLQ